MFRLYHYTIKNLFFFLLCSIISVAGLSGQVEVEGSQSCFDPIIQVIGDLEADRDPKCHATANRLEDFMFGTPLDFQARTMRMEFQKSLVYSIWHNAAAIAGKGGEIDIKHINQASIKYFQTVSSKGKIYVKTSNNKYREINETDLRQYSSIAYSLRAILAVQQQSLFDPEPLPLLNDNCVSQLKAIVDMATLSVLNLADAHTRIKNRYTIGVEDLEYAVPYVIHENLIGQAFTSYSLPEKGDNPYSMLRKTIKQKLISYEKYNEVSQSVFLRNIQVYFAKVLWPKDQDEANQLVSDFQAACMQYAGELMYFAESLAIRDSMPTIHIDHVNRALHSFLPYTVNEFEDVIYFPKLRRKDQIVIESYDLDAFRDSGLHWKLIEFVLDNPDFAGTLEPDPFAAELLAEGIAQFGVLLWRVGGHEVEKANESHLSPELLQIAMNTIRELTKSNNGRYGLENERQSNEIASSSDTADSISGIQFIDVTQSAGINGMHRSSDWLSRRLRSFTYKEDENLARMAIPPAFGGSGIAAEDINHDGLDDILILSGVGNKLYLNNGDKTFTDISTSAGIVNLRENMTHAEPRQPIIADFDNDGHQDIFISYVDDVHRIYKGDGKGNFLDMSRIADLGGLGLVAGPCTALDYDKDGLLDLYIGYFGNYLEGELPTLARHNTNGSPNQLFRNTGGFTFVNVTEGSGVDNTGWTQAVGHTDINNDGWQDLIAGNDFGNNAYYLNQGDGTFANKSSEYNTDKPSYTMNIGITDLNRDNIPDFYISNIVVMEKDDKYVLPNEKTEMHFDPQSLSTMRVLEANDLFLSNYQNKQLSYENSKDIDRAYLGTGWSWDADFFDYDNDGDDDLYCLNGMNPYSVYGENHAYYSSPEGDQASAVFAQSKKEHNVFFVNQGGRLTDGSKQSGLDLYHTSRSAAYLDYDNDGDLDVILNNYHGPTYLYENKEGEKNNWITFRLEDYSEASNRDAIGARIILDTKSTKGMWRELHSTDGYLSSHPKKLHFGLGKDEEVTGKIIWPDGEIHEFETYYINKAYIATRKNGELVLSEYIAP